MTIWSAGGTRAAIAAAGLGCAAFLVAACGAVGSGGAGTTPTASAGAANSTSPSSPQATSSPAQAAGTSPSGIPACTTSALRAAVDTSAGGAALGSTYYPIQFTNTSSSTCNLYGYPGVSFVTGAGGSQIGIASTENPAHPRQYIDLAPGQVAHANLQVTVAQNYPAADCGSVVTAHWLRIYPPNQTSALYASFTAQTCSSGRTTLSVETVESGSTGV
jgi:hypothetical protein